MDKAIDQRGVSGRKGKSSNYAVPKINYRLRSKAGKRNSEIKPWSFLPNSSKVFVVCFVLFFVTLAQLQRVVENKTKIMTVNWRITVQSDGETVSMNNFPSISSICLFNLFHYSSEQANQNKRHYIHCICQEFQQLRDICWVLSCKCKMSGIH